MRTLGKLLRLGDTGQIPCNGESVFTDSPPLREYAVQREFWIYKEYVDHVLTRVFAMDD